MQKKPFWTTKRDVLASLDELSVFSKGQPNIANTKIITERSLEKIKIREREKLEAESARNERERLKQEEEMRREDQMLQEEEQERKQRQQSIMFPCGLGRAQLIQMRRSNIGRNASANEERDKYIREKIRKTCGYYGNDRIESYWASHQQTSDRCSASSEEGSSTSTPVIEDQFEDVESSHQPPSNDVHVTAEPVVIPQPIVQSGKSSTKPRGHRNALMAKLLDTHSETVMPVEPTLSDVRSMESPNDLRHAVYASSERPVCPSKFTCPGVYEESASFKSQWKSRNRSLKPSNESKNFFVEEYVYKKDEFPPL